MLLSTVFSEVEWLAKGTSLTLYKTFENYKTESLYTPEYQSLFAVIVLNSVEDTYHYSITGIICITTAGHHCWAEASPNSCQASLTAALCVITTHHRSLQYHEHPQDFEHSLLTRITTMYTLNCDILLSIKRNTLEPLLNLNQEEGIGFFGKLFVLTNSP